MSLGWPAWGCVSPAIRDRVLHGVSGSFAIANCISTNQHISLTSCNAAAAPLPPLLGVVSEFSCNCCRRSPTSLKTYLQRSSMSSIHESGTIWHIGIGYENKHLYDHFCSSSSGATKCHRNSSRQQIRFNALTCQQDWHGLLQMETAESRSNKT